MIKNILCISGKPGLFKLVSQGKNMLIVESLTTKKRTPAYSHDKIVSLGDIAIYTDEEEVPLSQVFQTLVQHMQLDMPMSREFHFLDHLLSILLHGQDHLCQLYKVREILLLK